MELFCNNTKRKFWSSEKRTQYNNVSWLKNIDYVDINSLNGRISNISWFQNHFIDHKITNKLPSYYYYENNTNENKEIKKTYKLRLYPTKDQKIILSKWSGCARYTYNKTIATLNNKKNNCTNWMNLRNRYVTAKSKKNIKNNFFHDKPWLLETPKHIRLSSVKSAVSMRKSALTNLKRGNIKFFKLGFKTKKKELSNGFCLDVDKSSVQKKDNKLIILSKSLGNVKYGRCKQLHKLIPNNKPEHDAKIQKDKFGDYYLLLTHTIPVKKHVKNHKTVASYDPGVVNYQTGYRPDGNAVIIGRGCDKIIIDICERIDLLISKIARKEGEHKKMKRKLMCLRRKLYYYKNELHHQTNNFICKYTSLIIYPKLDSKNLTLKINRKLRTKTARSLLNLGHGKALELLKTKVIERGCQLMIPTEAYTTQTCCNCGLLNKCGSDRIYKCECGYRAERDLHGAQNVLLSCI